MLECSYGCPRKLSAHCCDVLVAEQVDPGVEYAGKHVHPLGQLRLSYIIRQVGVSANAGQKLVPYVNYFVVEGQRALNLCPSARKKTKPSQGGSVVLRRHNSIGRG